MVCMHRQTDTQNTQDYDVNRIAFTSLGCLSKNRIKDQRETISTHALMHQLIIAISIAWFLWNKRYYALGQYIETIQ